MPEPEPTCTPSENCITCEPSANLCTECENNYELVDGACEYRPCGNLAMEITAMEKICA